MIVQAAWKKTKATNLRDSPGQICVGTPVSVSFFIQPHMLRMTNQ